MSLQAQHVYEFGPFRLDPSERILLQNGEPLSLTPKAFDLLVVLVQGRGRLLDKGALMAAVWPETAVEESNLTHHISVLRKVLGKGEGGRPYIETVPRRGYRFVAGVREAGADAAEKTSESPPAAALRRRQPGLGLALAAVAAGVAGFLGWRYLSYRSPQSDAASHSILPVTSSPGLEFDPAFSPDGKLVAYCWGGERSENYDIYVKPIDGGAPLRLTSDPATERSPAWSPDGRTIAFLRLSGGGSGIFTVPALGGGERMLTAVRRVDESPVYNASFMSWSPNGKTLAFSDR